jgi:2-dehydrotetronate isomerase
LENSVKFSANLNMLFQEVPFLDRFAAAAEAGFPGVEILNPYVKPPAEVAEKLRASGLECALINVPRGNWDAGERGLAAVPGREQEFEEHLSQGVAYCSTLGCERLHVLAGVGGDHGTYISNLRRAARRAAGQGITLTLEALNPHDMPGYFLRTQAQSAAVVEELGESNVKMQMDCYHMQITEGDLETKFRKYIALCAHVQIAGVPGRHEPNVGEVNYGQVLGVLQELGYKGWVGCEYHPLKSTVEGLGWMRER